MLTLLEIAASNVLVALALALLALLVGLCLRRPAIAHALWLLVLLKLLTPPLVRVNVPWPAAPTSAPAVVEVPRPPDPPPVAAAVEEPLADVIELPLPPVDDRVVAADPEVPAVVEPSAAPAAATWPVWVVGAWLGGSAAWLGLAALRALAFARLLRCGRPAGEPLRKQVEELAARIGVACPPILVMPGRIAPLIWGVFRPVLVLPESLLERVGTAGLRPLLAHELAHLRRGDPWVRGLELVACGLYWWCPVVWLACRELREAEEQCCDAWVVRTLPDEKKAYATALVDVLDFLSEAAPPAPLCSGLGPVADLKRRLTMILRGVTPHRLGRTATLATLLLAALSLPLLPGWAGAQREGQKEEGLVAPRAAAGLAPLVAADDLKRLEAELARKAAELEALKKRLHDMRAAPKGQPPVAGRPGVFGARAQGGGTIVIQISGLTGKPEEIEVIAKKLKEVLPGGDKRVIINTGGHSGMYLEALRKHYGEGRPALLVPPTPPAPPAPPAARRGGDIERKLDELMRGLEELRREIRGGRGPGGPMPGGPGPMGSGGGRP